MKIQRVKKSKKEAIKSSTPDFYSLDLSLFFMIKGIVL